MSLTAAQLTRQLRDLGVESGDILFVHSSFKSLGPVEGGAATVVAALEAAASLILMPAFNLVEKSQRAPTWNFATTPSTVGWLTEFFRTLPGTYRSDHYSHSVAARGPGAREFVADHRRREGDRSPWDLEPWGYTYGTASPMAKAYQANGKVLMLGVDYHSATYMHFIEVKFWNRQLAQPYYFINREKLGAHWDTLGKLRRGRVGNAACRLFRIREFVDTLLAVVTQQPEVYFTGYAANPPRTPNSTA